MSIKQLKDSHRNYTLKVHWKTDILLFGIMNNHEEDSWLSHKRISRAAKWSCKRQPNSVPRVLCQNPLETSTWDMSHPTSSVGVIAVFQCSTQRSKVNAVLRVVGDIQLYSGEGLHDFSGENGTVTFLKEHFSKKLISPQFLSSVVLRHINTIPPL